MPFGLRTAALLLSVWLLAACSARDVERLAISLAAGACQSAGGCSTYCADGRTAKSRPSLSCH